MSTPLNISLSQQGFDTKAQLHCNLLWECILAHLSPSSKYSDTIVIAFIPQNQAVRQTLR